MNKTSNHKAPDSLSLAILNELNDNARISNTEIGRRVGLSAPAVADRILKMEEQGVIRGYSLLPDLDKLGLTIQAFINFKATTLRHAGLMKLFDSIPELTEWYSVTGHASMILKIAVATSYELELVIQKLQEHGETSTSLILTGEKRSSALKRVFDGK